MRSYVVESLFFHNGYKCVVTFGDMGFRCGYVAVNPDHPLFGMNYSQDLCSPELLQDVKASTIGKRGIVDIFLWDGEATSLNMVLNVHRGLTYANLGHRTNYPIIQFDMVWWFGFDCGHYDDAMDKDAMQKYFYGKRIEVLLDIEMQFPSPGIVRTLEYVQQECRNLADQLDCIKDTLIETRTLLEEGH